MKIRLYDETPALVQPELLRFLEPLDHLIPNWCSHVWVAWSANDTDNPSTVADITAHYDYRWARMNVYASWLEQTKAFKRESLIHELMHLFIAPLSDYARDTVKLLVPTNEAEKFNKSIVEQIRERCESVTQDLACLMLNSQSARGVSLGNKELYAGTLPSHSVGEPKIGLSHPLADISGLLERHPLRDEYLEALGVDSNNQ